MGTPPYGMFFDPSRTDAGLIKFFQQTGGKTKWPRQFRGGWESTHPCAWDGNERRWLPPWGTRCTNGGWHPIPPRGDGGLLYLELYTNGGAEGPVPAEFEAFQTTQVIGLGHNRLTGTLWDTQYHTFCQRFDLAHNQFEGTLPENFMLRNNVHSEIVNLADNRLSGTIPRIISNLTNLVALLLNKNKFSGEVPDLSSLQKVRQLNLAENMFTGTIGKWLKEMKNVAWVHLNDNMFEGSLPELPPYVSHLYLSGNKWSGAIPESYGQLGYLKVFNCTGCSLECPRPNLLDHVYFSTHCKPTPRFQ